LQDFLSIIFARGKVLLMSKTAEGTILWSILNVLFADLQAKRKNDDKS